MQTLGPRLARKPLHLFWILDTSGSMGVAGKIAALNSALRDAVGALRDAVADNPGVELLVRVVAFDHDARWHVAAPVPIEQFEWRDVAVTPEGTTEVGRAIGLVTEQIRDLAAAKRGMPPALVLVSDGKPTDLKQPTFGGALRALAEEPWGQKASRMAIGIGADADMEALARFIGHDEIKPLRAGNAAQLAHYLRWASTVVVSELSRTGGVWDKAASAEADRARPAASQGHVPPVAGQEPAPSAAGPERPRPATGHEAAPPATGPQEPRSAPGQEPPQPPAGQDRARSAAKLGRQRGRQAPPPGPPVGRDPHPPQDSGKPKAPPSGRPVDRPPPSGPPVDLPPPSGPPVDLPPPDAPRPDIPPPPPSPPPLPVDDDDITW